MLSDLRLLERVEAGELRLQVLSTTEKKNPKQDHQGKLCVTNEMSLIVDDRFDPADARHQLAKLHRHITDSGETGASGKRDPKWIYLDGIRYQIHSPELPRCELCQSGDMIPPGERFRSSTYRPGCTQS
jgi:hypothetical protein